MGFHNRVFVVAVVSVGFLLLVPEGDLHAQDPPDRVDDETIVAIEATLPPGFSRYAGGEVDRFGPDVDGVQDLRVAIDSLLSREVARYRTNRLYEKAYGYRLVPEFLDLQHDQIVELGNRYNLFMDASGAAINEMCEQLFAAAERGDRETANEFRESAAEMRLDQAEFRRGFNHDIAEVLKPEQVSRLRAMAITTGLEHFGGWDPLLEKSMVCHGVDPELITRLKRDREFKQKLLELRQRHYLRLIELNQQTMDEFLELLPEEPKAAVERTLNIDTLTRTRPTGQGK